MTMAIRNSVPSRLKIFDLLAMTKAHNKLVFFFKPHYCFNMVDLKLCENCTEKLISVDKLHQHNSARHRLFSIHIQATTWTNCQINLPKF